MKTLNIIEAIKINETEEVRNLKTGCRYKVIEATLVGFWSIESILADWQIVPKTVTITREQLAEVWDTLGVVICSNNENQTPVFNIICKKLGL